MIFPEPAANLRWYGRPEPDTCERLARQTKSSAKPSKKAPPREPQCLTSGGISMRNTFAALVACAGIGLASPALAQNKIQDKTVRIGVLNDMSSLYADIGGPNSVVA